MPVIPLSSSPPTPDGWCGWDVEPTCASWADYTEAQQELVLTIATSIMWAATGRRFGACEITVRPCQSYYDPELYRAYPQYGDGQSWGPYLDGGVWRNRCCGAGCCCGPRCEVALHGPVAEMLQVMVDGVVLPEDAYRVDLAGGTYRLVRLDGECWPTCQDFNVAEDEEGAFAITYTRGTLVPVSVLAATGIFSCELAKSVVGAECRLPARMSALTRQGVSAQLVVQEIGDDILLTGLAEVDMVIRTYNPGRRQRPPVLVSPDMPEIKDRMTTWVAGS